ncbi:MAG: hypothetical protein SCH70_02345 [Candidatus Methanoperedens sp.]|nr:hypothetical protein [Candidatus Methanoperedens sp.]
MHFTHPCKKETECEECTPCDVCGSPRYTVNDMCGNCISCETPHVEMYEWN